MLDFYLDTCLVPTKKTEWFVIVSFNPRYTSLDRDLSVHQSEVKDCVLNDTFDINDEIIRPSFD